MSLQAKLDEYKANFRKTAPADVQQTMHQATADLRKSGILAGVLKKGHKAPHFALENGANKIVRSEDILSQRFMVLIFYRGRW
ncbi:MAG: hypothetical protein PVH74_04725 [Desulfobacterales bacterium]|jgi:hypothetical protein|nr:hypothetical protein [Deltaproteobacteria bacterium]